MKKRERIAMQIALWVVTQMLRYGVDKDAKEEMQAIRKMISQLTDDD